MTVVLLNRFYELGFEMETIESTQTSLYIVFCNTSYAEVAIKLGFNSGALAGVILPYAKHSVAYHLVGENPKVFHRKVKEETAYLTSKIVRSVLQCM